MLKSNSSSSHYITKSALCTLVICIMIMSLFVTESQAAKGTVTGSVVNIRSAPSNTGEIIGTVLKNTQVELLNFSGDWYQIKYAGLQGYVARELINANQQVQVISGPLNVRSGPGTSFDIIDSLADKAICTVLGEKDGWYQIQLADGRSAYIAGWLVEIVGESSAVQDEVADTTKEAAIPAVTSSSSSNPSVILNGSKMQFEVEPCIENGRTLVPLRAIFEAIGATVDWDENTRTVTAHNSNTTVVLPLDSTNPTVNGKVWQLEVPAKIVNNRTLAPLRFVGEAFGGTVDWDEQTRIINIAYTADQAPAAVTVSEDPSQTQETPTTEETEQAKAEEAAVNLQLFQDLAAYRTNLKLMDGSVINSEELLNHQPTGFSQDQVSVFKTYLNDLSKYQASIKLPDGTVQNCADISILGDSYLTADQLKQWIQDETPRLIAKANANGLEFKPIPDLAELYIKIGAEYGIRGDIAFCQAAKETGYWQFTGSVQPGQNNYCGLWATGSALTGQESLNGADPTRVSFQAGLHGATFTTPAAGVEAHIQHLYAYATKNPLPNGKMLVDPRFILVNRGIAPSWLQLNARWAVPGTTYGQSILNDYWLSAAN